MVSVSMVFALIVFSWIPIFLAGDARCDENLYGSELCRWNGKCAFDADLNITGSVSRAEFIIQGAHKKALGRIATMGEKASLYTLVKNNEISRESLELALISHYSAGSSAYINWTTAYPNKVYAWTVDLHPSPAACNQVVYRDIGVTLHAEVDHHPFCEYYGVCSSDRLKVFGIGAAAVGFSLDPDHNVLKRQFYEHYKNVPEFERVDVFVCSHPAANCELFESFLEPTHNKSAILFFTTRFEFGRNDMNINWRQRTVHKWNAHGELHIRDREWAEFVLKHHSRGKLFLTANSMFDKMYVEYLTGLKPEYIPSWCGDLDGSYNLQSQWTGCDAPQDHAHYAPIRPEIIIVPYKQKLWARYRGGDDNTQHGMYRELQQALVSLVAKKAKGRCTESEHIQRLSIRNCSAFPNDLIIEHSIHALHDHQAKAYKKFPAVIFLSYQTSIMTFFELYRQNIPIFAPSLSLLVRWDIEHHIVDGRVYGWPIRHADLIAKYTGHVVEDSALPPHPNMRYHEAQYNASAYHWLQYSDIYHFPHIQLFDSWDHLLELIQTVNLAEISQKMFVENRRQRVQIMRQWDALYRRAAPHRSRGAFVQDTFVMS